MTLLRFPIPVRSETSSPQDEIDNATPRQRGLQRRRPECPLGCEVEFGSYSDVDAHLQTRHPGYFDQIARLLTNVDPDLKEKR